MFLDEGFVLFVTSRCNASCVYCNAKHWMKAFGDYQLSVEQVEKFIHYSQEAGYRYANIFLHGGEPLLWDHIEECSQILKEANITDRLCSFTNALAVTGSKRDFFGHLLRHIDWFHVSNYGFNILNIERLRALSSKKFKSVDHRIHIVPPLEPFEDVVPELLDCCCEGYGLIGDRVLLCGGGINPIYRLGKTLKDYPDFSVSLGPNFLDELLTKDKLAQTLCSYCISNKKVSDRCPSYNNSTRLFTDER